MHALRTHDQVTALRGQKRSRDMDEWSTEHVVAWFMSLPQMEQFCPAIVSNHVDGNAIRHACVVRGQPHFEFAHIC